MSQVPCETCETCGELVALSLVSRRCTNCYEVESRLEEYLQSPGGQKWARDKMPLMDDWVDGHPDAWDYETVLAENEVKVEWCAALVDSEGNVRKNDCFSGWSLSWREGFIGIGDTTEEIAKKAGALFISLWLRGVSASFADKLMDGFIVYLERQEGITKGVMVNIGYRMGHLNLCFGSYTKEDQLLREFGLKEGDRVGVTLSKRGKNGS